MSSALSLENPPGFVVSSEVEKVAFDNGYRISLGRQAGWLRFASTTAPGAIELAATGRRGPWFLSVDHTAAAAELSAEQVRAPGRGTFCFSFSNVADLHAAVDRIYQLSVSLPEAPLGRFRSDTADLPQTTEVERLMVQRIGQDIFREALLSYWGARCPLTGISDTALLRASHIVPWSECDDAHRLDVHNGLLLSALWDAAFDRGLISFDHEGMVLESTTLSAAARAALGLEFIQPRLQPLRDAHRTNLAKHRARHGLG